MKITITGSLGNISRILTEKLLNEGHEVSVITSNPENVHVIEGLGATALLGKLDDEDFVKDAFKGADAVYTMVPPSYGTKEDIKRVGEVYVRGIKENEVPYVVNLSGIGSHLENGPGPSGANYHNERHFNAIEGAHILHLRPGLFYSNFYGAMDMIKHQHIMGNNFDENVVLALSHPHDVARVAFEAIHFQNFTGKESQYVVSTEITGKEIADALGEAVGIPNLQWIEFPDQAMLEGMLQQGMTPEMATTYIIDMGIALREGRLLETYFKERESTLADATSFEAFAKEFAQVFNLNQ